MWYIKCVKLQWILSAFDFGTTLGPTGGKYLIKIIFDFKIEIDILKILGGPTFDKSWAFLTLGLIWVEQAVNVS